MTAGHIGPDRLLEYAAGSLPDGMALLVAAHLTFCPGCRARVARLEMLGGAVLAEAAPGVAAPDIRAVLARIDGEDPPEACCPAEPSSDALPLPLRQRLGRAGIRWRFRLPGLSEHRLPGFLGEDVRLIRGRPGTRIPAHTHCGEEATLVLAGALKDGTVICRRGDVAIADEGHEHGPEIVGDEDCICLAVLSAGVRFTGPLGRALNLFS